MKKEDVEWLTLWIWELYYDFCKVKGQEPDTRLIETIEKSIKGCPPPIDEEEQIKGSIGYPGRGPLPWGRYRIRDLRDKEYVILDGAIYPEKHTGHKVKLITQHHPCCNSDLSFGTVVLCQSCKGEYIKVNSQFLEKIEEEPK